MATKDTNRGFLLRAQKIFFLIGCVYVGGLALLCVPVIQRQAVYLHMVRWPTFARFDAPHYHGLAPFKGIDITIQTQDNVSIKAWYILSEPAYQTFGGLNRQTPVSDDEIKKSLEDYPTVLFFHGNAASRAVKYRVQVYSGVTSILHANVLVIDYRGFADSEGTPSEEGLNFDALAAWKWLMDRGTKATDVVVLGQSLGTGVATKLVSQLGETGVAPRALVLVAPFSSVVKLLETYTLGGIFPILRPIQGVPFLAKFVAGFVRTRFSTVDLLPSLRCPIVLVHAKDDDTIPHSHSAELFNTLLEPYLPPLPFKSAEVFKALSFSSEQHEAIRRAAAERKAKTDEIVSTRLIGPANAPLGTLKQLDNGRISYFDMEHGGHSELVRWEGVLGLVGQVARIERH